MKKILVMSALVAISTAFVACSNENDLVQQKPEVPEEPTVQYPMTISVTTPTRGTDLTATSLNDFKLYSNIDDSWHNGARFTKVDNQWSNVNSATMGWGTNPNQDYTFYGISDYDNITVVSSNAQIPNVTDTENPISFGYTMPTIRTYDDSMDSVVYTTQKDLLVCNTTTSYNAGDPKGQLIVNFTHALAQITKIKVYCSAEKMETVSGYDPDEDIPYWRFRIGGIRIGGLKYAGTYTFGAVAPWTVSGFDAEFEIPLKTSEMTFAKTAFQPGTKANAITLPLTDDGLYLIPQVANGSLVSVSSGLNVSGPYVEFDAQVGHYGDPDDLENSFVWDYAGNEDDPVDWTEADSEIAQYKKIRIPLKFDIAANGAGRGYTLILDISNAIVWEKGANRNQYVPIFGEGVTIKVG